MLKNKRIGIVGLGRMGANIARRLVDCGYRLAVVYDVQSQVARELANELNTEAVERLDEVSAQSDIIFTVVSDDAAMKSIFSKRKNSLLAHCKQRVFINCATVTPDIHRQIEALVTENGGRSIEACMASSIPQARSGELYLMIGGQKPVFTRMRPLLQDLSTELMYIGPAGTAAQVKALVNMVMNSNTAALAEGLGLGDALGLDLTMLRKVFSQTGANSRVLETDGEDMQEREHSCYFSAAHAAKDSAIALSLGRKARLSLPVAEATAQQYQRMVDNGLGELDKSGISELTFKGRGPKGKSAQRK